MTEIKKTKDQNLCITTTITTTFDIPTKTSPVHRFRINNKTLHLSSLS